MTTVTVTNYVAEIRNEQSRHNEKIVYSANSLEDARKQLDKWIAAVNEENDILLVAVGVSKKT